MKVCTYLHLVMLVVCDCELDMKGMYVRVVEEIKEANQVMGRRLRSFL